MPSMTRSERGAIIRTIPGEEIAAAHQVLHGLLPGWNSEEDPDPLIDAPMFAVLAGVAPSTPGAWQQRTRDGSEKHPFPEPGETRYRDKPQWFAISQALRYLMDSGRWPRGVVAREKTRAEQVRRITFKELKTVDPATATALWELRAEDDKIRTVQGWRSLRTRRSSDRHAPQTSLRRR